MLMQTPPAMTDNQRAVLGAVLAVPDQQRLELSIGLGLSAQTIMRAVLPLIDSGVLLERTEPAAGRGKPARSLRFAPGTLATLGISVASDHIRVSCSDLAGAKLLTAKRARAYETAAAQLDDLDELVAAVMAGLPDGAILVGAGVSVQGYLLDGGRRILARVDPAGWAAVDLAARLRDQLGLPVHLMNDGKTLASSLIRTAPEPNFLCVHLGTGVGGGLVSNGTLIVGANGNAGEIGQFFPHGPDRPVEQTFQRAAGLKDWSGWNGIAALPGADQDRLTARLESAGAMIGDVLAQALALLDFQAAYICSRMPADLLQALVAQIDVMPLGQDLAGAGPDQTNPPPAVHACHVPNHANLACRMAAEAFLSPTAPC